MEDSKNSKLIIWLQALTKSYSIIAMVLLSLFIIFLIGEFGYRSITGKGLSTLPTLSQPAPIPYDYLNQAPYYAALDDPNQLWDDTFEVISR